MKPRLVLLAAGRSSRYGQPKQVAPLGLGGASLTAYTVVDALRGGFGEVVVVTNRELRPRLQAHLEGVLGRDLPLAWAYQEVDALPPGLTHLAASRRKPWGTAQAILAAAPHLPGPFGVANADDWYGPEALAELARVLASPDEFPAEPPLRAGVGDPDAPDRVHGPGNGGHRRRHDGDGQGPIRSCPAVAVGYPMEVTLSPSGGVSRGWIMADDAGVIRRVLELREVRGGSGGRMLGVDPDGMLVTVPSGSPASMNLWGFHPCLLPRLREAFHSFLLEMGADGTSEFALSNAVDRLLEEDFLQLRLIPGGKRWFGVTHPGDAESVSRRLEALHRDGTYPTPLSRAPA